ncbi:MAG TPA: hypothetical protein V6D28_08430 [Leptolyngbyaceae cyanobacterium]
MKRRSLLYFISGFALASVTSLLPVAAQTSGITRRVQFARGRSSTTINGSVPLGKRDTYIFRANRGQEITTDVTWLGERVDNVEDQGLSGFIFIEPDGETYEDPQNIYFEAKSTGDYKVIVRQPYRISSPRYRFELTIK